MKEIWIQAPNLFEISYVVRNSQKFLDLVPNAMIDELFFIIFLWGVYVCFF